MTSDPEISISLHPETPAPFKDEATALAELPLNHISETLVATQPDSLKLATSDSPGTVELKAPQNSSPKGPDALPLSARIAGPPAPPGPSNQPAPATQRVPQRRSRGERVNTIIVVERVKETGEGRGPGLLGLKGKRARGRDSRVRGRRQLVSEHPDPREEGLGI